MSDLDNFYTWMTEERGGLLVTEKGGAGSGRYPKGSGGNENGNHLAIDKSRVQRSLDNGSLSSNKFNKKGVGELYDAQKSGKDYSINVVGETDYGANLEIEVGGKKTPLTKAQVRHTDIEGYFGAQPKAPEIGKPTGASRVVGHTDVSKVKPQHAAGTGETVRMQDGSIFEYVGISGYASDNKTNTNGWRKIK